MQAKRSFVLLFLVFSLSLLLIGCGGADKKPDAKPAAAPGKAKSSKAPRKAAAKRR